MPRHPHLDRGPIAGLEALPCTGLYCVIPHGLPGIVRVTSRVVNPERLHRTKQQPTGRTSVSELTEAQRPVNAVWHAPQLKGWLLCDDDDAARRQGDSNGDTAHQLGRERYNAAHSHFGG